MQTVVIAGRECPVNEDRDGRRPARFRFIVQIPGIKMSGPDGHKFDVRGFGQTLWLAEKHALRMMSRLRT